MKKGWGCSNLSLATPISEILYILQMNWIKWQNNPKSTIIYDQDIRILLLQFTEIVSKQHCDIEINFKEIVDVRKFQ